MAVRAYPAARTGSRAALPTWLAPRSWGPAEALLLFYGLCVAAYLAWTTLLWVTPWSAGAGSKTLVSDLLYVLLGPIAVWLTWRPSRHPTLDGKTRTAWRLLALGQLCWWVANVVWAYYEVILDVQPFPSPADGPYLAFYPAMLWGLLSFPMALRTNNEKLKFWLDAATVLMGAGMVIWYFVLGPTAFADHSDLLSTALLLAYPVGDLVLLLGIVTLVLRTPAQGWRRSLGLLAAGLLLFVVADLGYGSLSLAGTFETGQWPDQLWMLAIFLMTLSSYLQYGRAPQAEAAEAEASDGLQPFNLLPYVSLAIGAGLLLLVSRAELSEPLGGVIVVFVLLTGLVIVRQIAAIRENVRLLAERTTRRNEARFRSLVQNSSDVIMVIEADSSIRYQSPSAERLLGYSPAELAGARLLDLVHPDDAARARGFLELAVAQPHVTGPVEWRLRHQDGSWLQVETKGNNLLHDINVRGVVLNTRDVAERTALEGELLHQAFHDPLTGLANRALFRDRVGHALTRAARSGERVTVLFLDLDHFKTVNDSLGHAAGDRVIVGVVERLRLCLRDSDTAARLGGDEFAILLEDVDSPADAVAAAERIIAALQAPLVVDGREVHISTSIGISTHAGPEEGAEELLRNADVAMYRAKAAGRGRYEIFEPSMHAAVLEQLELAADLRQALEHGQFRLAYQPIVLLDTERIIGAEALLRWRHPRRGDVAPLDFIPLAEETGLIVPIGQWVLREACRQARRWRAAHAARPAVSVAVNVSGRELQQPDFVATVAKALADADLDPHSLIVEITESVLIQDTEAAVDTLGQLRALGVRVAIDDFGTGYSSLSYLRRFPIDILKVDRSFVDGIAGRPEQAALLQNILAIGETLKLRTLTEGIEDPADLERLQAFGCQLGQGFIFAKPLDPRAFDALLAADETRRVAVPNGETPGRHRLPPRASSASRGEADLVAASTQTRRNGVAR